MIVRLDDIARPRFAAAMLFACALAACRADQPLPEPGGSAAVLPAVQAGDPAPLMTIAVTEVSGVPDLEAEVIRGPLRDAEGALLSCIDGDGSTGVVAMKVAIERDGFVGGVALRDRTTYGSDAARACLLRIVDAMRFGSTRAVHVDVDITLDVSTRFRAP